MKVSNDPAAIIITHSLGSCIGVAIHDPVNGVGGLLHFQLPESKAQHGAGAVNPFKYADTALPALFRTAYMHGAEKKRLVVKVAGGANVAGTSDLFQIGKRNYVSMRRLLWMNKVFIDAEDVGGDSWRTMWLEIGTGRVFIKNSSGEFEL